MKEKDIGTTKAELIEKRCPYAAHFSNTNKYSYKELEFRDALLLDKSFLQQAVQYLYGEIKDYISSQDSAQAIIDNLKPILTDSVLDASDKMVQGNQNITDSILRGISHAVRTIYDSYRVYYALGGKSEQAQDGIRKLVYRFATVSISNIKPLDRNLRLPDILGEGPHNAPFDGDNFFIDDQGNLMIDDIVDLKNKYKLEGRCPVVGLKVSNMDVLIIDDLIQKLNPQRL